MIQFETPAKTENCHKWNKQVIAEIADGDYDLVVLSNRTNRPLKGLTREQTFVEVKDDYAQLLSTWTDAGVPVLVLRDAPYATDLKSVPDCVAANLDDLSACDGTRAREQVDPLADIAASMANPLLEVVDLTDRICKDDTCYATLGGVIVYFDRGHMSATFARTLAPEIVERAAVLLGRS